jgi:hypothetical protein
MNTAKLQMFTEASDGDLERTRLKITEMMLEAEIGMYAARPPPRDLEVEKCLRRRVVIPPGILRVHR